MTERTVIVLRESACQSIVSDTYTVLCVLALIGVGIWCQSSAMEWAGFLAAAVIVATSEHKRLSPQEAADHLREKYGVVAECGSRRAGEKDV